MSNTLKCVLFNRGVSLRIYIYLIYMLFLTTATDKLTVLYTSSWNLKISPALPPKLCKYDLSALVET